MLEGGGELHFGVRGVWSRGGRVSWRDGRTESGEDEVQEVGFYSAVVPIYRRFPHSPSYPERVGRRRRFTRAGGALGELEERGGTGVWGGEGMASEGHQLSLSSVSFMLSFNVSLVIWTSA